MFAVDFLDFAPYSKSMKTANCAKCGNEFKLSAGRGRPRTKCDACRPGSGKVTAKRVKAPKVVVARPPILRRADCPRCEKIRQLLVP